MLDQAAPLVKAGGRLAYITCSLLAEENTDQITGFLSRHPQFRVLPTAEAWARAGLSGTAPQSADGSTETLLLTPRHHGTDGFFISILTNAPA